MNHDSTPMAPPIQKIRLEHAFGRVVPLLVFLFATSLIWSCTGRGRATPDAIRCPPSIFATVNAAKPTVNISYKEPSLSATGKELDDLAKTSIYYDLGRGRVLAKDVPATSPSGGGQISETITIPIKSKGEQSVAICVTATDRQGNESVSPR